MGAGSQTRLQIGTLCIMSQRNTPLRNTYYVLINQLRILNAYPPRKCHLNGEHEKESIISVRVAKKNPTRPRDAKR